MVSLKCLLLSLVPVFTRSPVTQILPGLLSTSEWYNSSLPDPDSGPLPADYLEIAAAAEILEREGYIRSTLEARPEQGGHRITLEWLEGLLQRECLWRFRFTAQELVELCEVLKLPAVIKTRSRYRATALEALCLTCARLARAGDLYDLITRYNRSESAISELINYTICTIDLAWARLLDFDHTHLLAPPKLAAYAAAIHTAGAPMSTVWGFIDCTIRRIARPSHFQEATYSGYKKFHALKYQAVALPNGIIVHLFGPWEGRNADPFLLAESGLLEKCSTYATQEGSNDDTPLEHRYFQLFGDPAYGLGPQLVSPFSGPGARTEAETAWNARMAAVRIKVEHAFGGVVNNWAFLNTFWKQRVYSSPVGRYYRVAVLLTNALNCVRPNQFSISFDCPPPTLREYFHS